MENYLMRGPEEIKVLKNFTDVLDELGIEYAIGGSVASSIYGRVRFTQDTDITVEPFDSKAEEFFRSVRSDFYISRDAMHQALKQRKSFNVVHLESAFKIDVFVRKETAFEKQLISRRKTMVLSDDVDRDFSVVSPEDIILLKLQWYKQGDCASEKQLGDILGVLEVQTDKLDFGYMKKWAEALKVNELLEKAISQSKS